MPANLALEWFAHLAIFQSGKHLLDTLAIGTNLEPAHITTQVCTGGVIGMFFGQFSEITAIENLLTDITD